MKLMPVLDQIYGVVQPVSEELPTPTSIVSTLLELTKSIVSFPPTFVFLMVKVSTPADPSTTSKGVTGFVVPIPTLPLNVATPPVGAVAVPTDKVEILLSAKPPTFQFAVRGVEPLR